MKKLLLSLCAATALFACSDGEKHAHTVSADGTVYAHYGDKITPDGAMSTEELVAKMAGQTSIDAKFTGTIIQTCQKKGCWMSVALPDGNDMTVTFKDYGFFVPTEGVEQQTFVAQGVCSYDTLSVEWLQHLAEDAGKTAEEIAMITEPEFALAFEATGVVIKEPAGTH
jgi:hypothetical protein